MRGRASSTNEKLATVNEELHNRIVQLGVVNDDVANRLAHVSTAAVLVGSVLRVRRFSRSTKRITLVSARRPGTDRGMTWVTFEKVAPEGGAA